MKSVFISGSNGLPASYGGWDPLLNELSNTLSLAGYKVIVHTESKRRLMSGYIPNNVKIKFISLSANGKASVFYDLFCLCDAYLNKGIVIMLGTSGGLFIPIFRLLGLKIITNLDGEEWKRNKWSFFAKKFLLISDFAASLGSNIVIADHPEIFKRAKRIAFKAYYIPYGSNHCSTDFNSLSKNDISGVLKKYKLEKNNYFFKVCRIEPENNIHIILSSFSELPQKLLIIGNWKNSDYGINLRKKYERFPNLYLYDAMYEKKELDILRKNSIAYLHGHSVGGTNPSLIEAMIQGCMILAHDNKYNRYVTDNQCFYFSEIHSIKESVEDILSISKNKRLEICNKVQKRAFEYYSWDKVLENYRELVDKLAQ